MDIPQFLYLFTSLASALAAMLAWIAKIRWSNEFAKAKDEIIKAKDEQNKVLEREIQSLKELNPIKVRESFVSLKMQLEEYIDLLKNQLTTAQTEKAELHNKIKQLEQEIYQIRKKEKIAGENSSTLEEIEIEQKAKSITELSSDNTYKGALVLLDGISEILENTKIDKEMLKTLGVLSNYIVSQKIAG